MSWQRAGKISEQTEQFVRMLRKTGKKHSEQSALLRKSKVLRIVTMTKNLNRSPGNKNENDKVCCNIIFKL